MARSLALKSESLEYLRIMLSPLQKVKQILLNQEAIFCTCHKCILLIKLPKKVKELSIVKVNFLRLWKLLPMKTVIGMGSLKTSILRLLQRKIIDLKNYLADISLLVLIIKYQNGRNSSLFSNPWFCSKLKKSAISTML